MPKYRKVKDQKLEVCDLKQAILAGDRKILAQAVTLVESQAPDKQKQAQELLQELLPFTGNSIRIGITGVPGAGKSTFIEALGLKLCEKGHRLAVLAVDPSSSVSGGSILGDKTRMEELSKHPNAFIRPSPSGGTLGGVHRKTRESIILCEAAGFDIIFVETVGVGQSEVIVRELVDFFLLLVITGAGDDLQGMKKGIMELADAIAVNKADGENERQAELTRKEYNQILSMVQPATQGWKTRAYTCSALHHKGLDELWEVILAFIETTKASQVFYDRRKLQSKQWLLQSIRDELETRFYTSPEIRLLVQEYIKQVVEGKVTVTQAVNSLFSKYEDNILKK
ncbi:MAG TPA: methylmalonyl Co-A mutase-associated GTPase MeaB [Bacillus sp. (in: firmicutes)]|uniref:methylmalonyl Co-A mutase-associated GTPase MeaB n=1 Tax=Bacillus litorisediminis TaxID=2922713 RepID=UPI001FABC0DA|nr:methylmalonyl Co-A mutase-associated GTPase MeaB [Bacillus litorisediminis]HWO76197.1 methylmalonyl Co-A mutase-associated GTPase MeaB [Bacillus sp. (in: firmicutes)]